MKKLLLALILCPTLLLAADFFVLARQAAWNALNPAKKTQVKTVFAQCTTAPISIGFSWNYTNTITGEVWGAALYSGNAWALKQKETMDVTKIQTIQAVVSTNDFILGWTTNFAATVAAANLVKIKYPSQQ